MMGSKKAMLLTLATCCLSGTIIAQNISINMSNVTVKEAMNELQKKSGYSFIFSSDDVDTQQKISVNVEDKSVTEVVHQILDGQNVSYKIKGNTIIIKNIGNQSVSQDNKTITGKVVDVQGLPVVGANIVEKGSTNGTITDIDGNFSLNVTIGSTLHISYIGYSEYEVKIGKQSKLSIVLHEDSQVLDELVVVGYGSQSKSSLSSSIVEIKGDKLTNLPVANISRAIDSYVPGVTASATLSETPGSAPTLSIRGENSINNSAPLVLIDGMQGDMNTINPNDIENISVLKDAASAAIYGARAAGGVILITTKKGKQNEKIKISYNGSFSLREATRLGEKLDGWTYAQQDIAAKQAAHKFAPFDDPLVLEALQDPNVTEIPQPTRPKTHFIGTSSVDHVREMLGTGGMHDHSLSITGGSEKLSFLVSGGFLKEDALYNYGDFGYKRYNLRSNVNFKFSKYITMGLRLSYNNSNTDQPVRGWDMEMHQAYYSQSTNPIKWTTTGMWGGNNDGNPIQDLVEGGHDVTKDDHLDLSANLEIKPIKGLVWNTIVGGNLDVKNRTQEFKSIYRYSVNPNKPVGKMYVPNSLIRSEAKVLYRNIQTYATYDIPFFEKHSLRVMGGASYEDNQLDRFSGKREQFLSNDLMSSLDLGIGDQYSNGNITEWAISSFFARLNYNFDQRYFIEASFRSDGSSRFVKGKRWGYFPSVSASWRVIGESFLENQNVLSDLKLRASWGSTGNQNSIGLYDYIAQMKLSDQYYPLGKSNDMSMIIEQKALASKDRSWETVQVANIALDFGFLRNRLTGSFEYYQKRNKDMLIPVELPSVIGMQVPTFNAGELEVKGWEGTIHWQDQIGKDFSYGVSFTIQDSKNKITKFEGSKSIIAGKKNIEGYPIGSYFGYKTDGLFQSKEEVEGHAFQHLLNDAGDVKYVDLDGSGKIDAGDLTYLGNIQPRYVYNIGINLKYKNFDVEFLFDGVGKKLVNLNTDLAAPVNVARFVGQTDSWTPENRNAMWPRAYFQDRWNWWISDRTLHNAAYFSMKNFQLGYTLPKTILDKIYVENLRLYVNIRNPFIIDNYVEYLDPRLNSYNNYPVLRSYTIGLNLTF